MVNSSYFDLFRFIPLKFDVMHLINRKQNGVKLTVGPFETINRDRLKIVSVQCRVPHLIQIHTI